MLGPLRNLFTDKDKWFALYAIDNNIDDETFCEKVKRGQFRLHPEGPLGIGEGCITIKNQKDYQLLYSILKNTKKIKVPNAGFESYGVVTVK